MYLVLIVVAGSDCACSSLVCQEGETCHLGRRGRSKCSFQVVECEAPDHHVITMRPQGCDQPPHTGHQDVHHLEEKEGNVSPPGIPHNMKYGTRLENVKLHADIEVWQL